MIDLLVIGGGPVGLMTAIHARLAGLEVVVLERRRSQPDKACGEGLMPDALRRLHAVGVDPAGMDFGGIAYVAPGRRATARFADGTGRGVRRTVLRAALEARAEELGAVIVDGRVDEVANGEQGVVVNGVEARYAVAADGLHSPVREQVGLARPAGRTRRYGARRHYRIAPWDDVVEVHWSERAEVYLTPVGPELVGVAVLGPRPLSFDDVVDCCPEVRSRLAGAAPVGTTRGAGPLLQPTSRRTRGRVLLVGDAAGYVDALTGEGLRLGFAEAEAAVIAVLTEDPASYERAWRSLTRPYRLLTHGLLAAASFAPTRRAIVPAASRAPWAFRRAVDVLAG
ncbi:MAG TPA: NAD(P)/FAD-dependent oxidoreductase [Candidatus Nanopelagicales bacterium]|nr:NAD(P)/FAD-dependent oxidoreductase [Candidatus Nanopelagicales bacterium]